MCGRYTRAYNWRQVHDFLRLHLLTLPEMPPSYNVAPTQTAPVGRIAATGGRELVPMQWGFAERIPVINARSETVKHSPFFGNAFARRRCVIPATGFYEWQRTGDVKQAFHFTLLNEPMFAFAGLWEPGTAETPIDRFVILTTEPNAVAARVHNRMPVILRQDAVTAWLESPEPDADAMFQPFPAEEMMATPVSNLVNSPKNDSPDLMLAASSESLWN
jgi:putative SOS response-associated peptidase YedK